MVSSVTGLEDEIKINHKIWMVEMKNKIWMVEMKNIYLGRGWTTFHLYTHLSKPALMSSCV